MRTLKENFFGNLGIGKKKAIEDWLKKYKIKYYTINPDLTIYVNGDVDLQNYSDKELPDYIQFNYIKGIFDISNSNITSLRGSPKECEIFYCNECDKLISLDGAPKECEIFDCGFCHSLTSLEGAPEKCEEFYSQHCDNLTSLKGAPKECDEFYCNYSDNLTSLKGAPKKCQIFNCYSCKGKFTEEDVRKVCNAKKIYCD